jgi:hypothetical protein
MPSHQNYIFPYSSSSNLKRQEVISNLQNGILLEDINKFIPWSTPFRELDSIAMKREDRSDRTMWYLGDRKIIGDMQCHAEICKWSYQPDTSTFDEITDNLGSDQNGYERFKHRISHLAALLGAPTNKNLQSFGQFEIGNVEWVYNNFHVVVSGVEIFNCRYSLSVGLIENSHNRDLAASVEEMKRSGLTEEELGK